MNTEDGESNIERLRMLISFCEGETWDNKVRALAIISGRSKSMVYKWLSGKPHVDDLALDGLEHRVLCKAAD